MRSLFGVLPLMGVAQTAAAQGIVVDLDNERAQELGVDDSALSRSLSDAIGESLRVVDQEEFLRGMANAAAISTRGMGVDYASNVKKFAIGGSFGSGVAAQGAGFGRGDTPLPSGGFSAQFSLMAGLNLGALSPSDGFLDRVRIFANGMALNLPSSRELAGSFETYGVNLQVDLVPMVSAEVVKWGGLTFTSGFQRTNFHLGLEKAIPVAASGDPSLAWEADGTYDVDVTADTIPLELSTNLRVVFFTVFAGGAYDVNLAEATSRAALDGPVHLRSDALDDDEPLGTATVSLTDDGVGDDGTIRGFGGAQFNVTLLKLYGQVNVGANETFGGHVGARLVW